MKIKNQVLFLITISIFTLLITSCSKSFKTVEIGDQVWMTENLNIDQYRNGDQIPEVSDPSQWASLTSGAWCYYLNNRENGKTYGKLYNWYAVNDPRGLAPEGWHVPSDDEWTTLTNFLGGERVAGGKLKESGNIHWPSNKEGATNNIGFRALPGGYRHSNYDVFDNIGWSGDWWSSSKSPDGAAWSLSITDYNSSISKRTDFFKCGFSVRCVLDSQSN